MTKMTIKTKLIANAVVTTGMILFISLAGISSMSFLQEKLSYLAEKSTPFQMRTVELQRELQGSITALIKVNTARTMAEYSLFRAAAEETLEKVRYDQERLEKMGGVANRLSLSAEFTPVAHDLFAAAEGRLTNSIAAGEESATASHQMKESTALLKELETSIRRLQATRSTAFATAMESTGHLSARLRDIEVLRNQVKELILVSGSAQNARNRSEFLIAKGKLNTLMGQIIRNKSGTFIASDVKAVSDDMNDFLLRQSAALSSKDEISKKTVGESLQKLTGKMTRLHLTLNQELELAGAHLEAETEAQGKIFRQLNDANTILLTNSELVSLGLMVTGDINRLFTLESVAEMEGLDAEIRRIFIEISSHVHTEENSLIKLNAREELKILAAAAASLATIRTEIHAPDGIVTTLKKKLNSIDLANRSVEKLHAIVVKQSAQGKASVAAAQGEQEKSIIDAKTIIRQSLSRIAVIGSVAIAIGILFGFWIYRSVLLPLRVVLEAVSRQQEQGEETAHLAEAIAGGDLNREVMVSSALLLDPAQIKKDEVGIVLAAVVEMSRAQVTLDRAFSEMTVSLRSSRDEATRRDRLKGGLFELNKILRVEKKNAELADEALAFMVDFLGAGVGIIYLYDETGEMLQTLSTFAISGAGRLNWGFRLGEGLPGQSALERKIIHLTTVPPDYLPITSALGEADPLNVAILPIMHNDILAGVLEIGSFKQFNEDDFDFLAQSLEGIAIAFNVNRSRQLVNDLLEQTQAQAEELQAQQEALQQTNEEWEERARMLAERETA
ncbi:MAG: GAF domain-containing protein [Proteobacteria bacterium]|nr:GAF domain-containing protein [Pseudomonadota bacterium]